MAGKTADSEAVGQAANALGKYIDEMNNNIQKMKDAATDCSDNMGSDAYSQKAIAKLGDCIKSLSTTIKEAETLQKTILQKKRQIEDSLKAF